MTPRLTADFWVQAYLTRLRLADIPAFVVRKGDPTAGAVAVKLSPLDGSAALFQRRFDLMADTRRWEEVARGAEAEIDALFDLDLHLRHVDTIFARVFGAD